MNFARGALGSAIALCVAAILLFVLSPAQAARMAGAADEPPPDRGRAAAGPGNVVAGLAGNAGSLRSLAARERDVAHSLNVYRNTMGSSPIARLSGIPSRVYVPNSTAATLDVIDPATSQVIEHLRVGAIPHHVTPSWDMTKLYVNNEGSSSLTVIDPASGRVTGSIAVPFPYNLYFTPDGKKAIVIVERLARIDFRDPQSWQLIKSVPIPWRGIDHVDFSADGRFLLGSTEWSGMLVKVDTEAMEITGSVNVGGLPIDVRLAPDGSVFYVTNQGRHGVSIVDANLMTE
ncbi:MAG: YncE family protein, partial [Candidatus Dormibacteraeota bacterium]|nr:YncE family protein [Candidatus Dormibacteraeota bacterium]